MQDESRGDVEWFTRRAPSKPLFSKGDRVMNHGVSLRRAARLAAVLTAIGGSVSPARAASHSDAPLIKQDPQANITDVYAFIGRKYDDASQKVLNVLVAVRPFSEPGDGPTYDRFADDARYSIHVANPVTGETLMRYDFLFSDVDAGLKNLDTILSYGLGTEPGPIQTIGDARQNFTQTYSVVKTMGNQSTEIASGLLVAPPNAGKNVTPLYNDAQGKAVSGAVDFASLDSYTKQAVYSLPTGEALFAGQRDDGFYADVPGIFDLLNVRIFDNNGSLADGLGQDGNGVDGFKGFNVLSFTIQIPVSSLPASQYNSVFFGQQTGVGVYASVSRRAIRLLKNDGTRLNAGRWIQVNRMGNPLFNEVLVALRDKDRYNRMSPPGDAANFAVYAQNPELARLANFVYQTGIAESGRTDLVGIFIPDVLRVATTTDPVRLAGQAGFHRLGFIGGDTTNGVSGGFPNGRRLGDDVVDIALTALASGPSYATITNVGDNADQNDIAYNQVFPYSATPHSGVNNRKDPGN
jgi:hypothetical protein